VCGSWGGVAGAIRYFADRTGTPRAAIEGTQIPADLLRQYAVAAEAAVVYDPRHRQQPLVAVRRLLFHGFELDRAREPLEHLPESLVESARGALVEALVTGVARHKDAHAVRHTLERLGELWRRSGGTLAGADGPAVRAALGARLAHVRSLAEFQQCDLAIRLDAFVSDERRRALEALPASVAIDGEHCPLDYEVEQGQAVVRIRMRERLARELTRDQVPVLDRPVAFTVMRRKLGALRAGSIEELRRALSGGGRPSRPPRGRATGRRRRP
jgi:hypothetical protein